jgi:hypothetical protein
MFIRLKLSFSFRTGTHEPQLTTELFPETERESSLPNSNSHTTLFSEVSSMGEPYI